MDDRDPWSVACLVVRPAFRRRGLMHALLTGAVEHARAHGATVVEGYPVVSESSGKVDVISGYVGTTALFERAGSSASSRRPRTAEVACAGWCGSSWATADGAGGRARSASRLRPMPTLPHLLLGMRATPVARERLHALLEGRTAVVTGGSRGVGAAVAHRLGVAGAHVVLLARDEDALERVADEIRAAGGSASVVAVDLRDTAAATGAGEHVVAAHGAPAVLVSNAGHSIRRDLADSLMRFHDVQRLAGVNMLGPIAFGLPLLAAMSAARDGHLVSVGSAGMSMPGAGWSAYTATKAGFEAWARSISPELRTVGVATTSIHLPLVSTAMSAPTYARTRVPAMSPDDAATWVCRAVLDRPRVIAPWWARLAGTATAATPVLADAAAGLLWRRSR